MFSTSISPEENLNPRLCRETLSLPNSFMQLFVLSPDGLNAGNCIFDEEKKSGSKNDFVAPIVDVLIDSNSLRLGSVFTEFRLWKSSPWS